MQVLLTCKPVSCYVRMFHVYVHLADPRLKLLIDPDIVTAQEGMLAELVCMVDCFCPGAVPEWSRADNTPLSDLAMVSSDELVCIVCSHCLTIGACIG